MAVQQGKGHVYGLTDQASTPVAGTITFKNPDGTSLSGYISPNLQTLRLTHSGDVDEIKDQNGEIVAIITRGERLECEFNFIPEGSSKANARASGQMPQLGSSATIANLPIIVTGSLSDSFNAANWFYVGGGTLNGNSDSHWTATFTLRRYPGITTTTAIT